MPKQLSTGEGLGVDAAARALPEGGAKAAFTPWRVARGPTGIGRTIRDSRDAPIAELWLGNGDVDKTGALIVTAVNNHHAMLEALREYAAYATGADGEPELRRIRENIRAILSRIDGATP